MTSISWHFSWHALGWAAIPTLVACVFLWLTHETHQLPPGPKRLPVIGNFLDIPKKLPWICYQQWAKLYGDVISVSILGQTIVILNSHAAIEDIVSRTRPSALSSRPFIKFAQLVGAYETNAVMMVYGKEWRERRRIIDKHTRTVAIQAYQQVQQEKLAVAMQRMLQDPARFIDHIREYTGATILSIVYGYDVKDSSDHFVKIAEELNALNTRTFLPDSLMVNILPFLARLPPWVLGSEYVWLLERLTHLSREVIHGPFEWTKSSIKSGTAKLSLVRDALVEISSNGGTDIERAYREAFGIIYGAASDTTVAALSSFVLAMVLYPSVQARAQAEIDRLIGRDRLPSFNDRTKLPYVSALLMEVLRWRPVTPQGVPHVAADDIVYGRYRIPKGAIIIGNTWGILHDQASYPEPGVFKPERFLSSDGHLVDDPKLEYAFGFGARRCPGRHLADATLWIFIATMLAAFNIAKAEGAEEANFEELYVSEGVIIHPLPFACHISPRDDNVRQVLQMV